MHWQGRDIVTIDGPSGAGKSTISRMLAAELHYTYLDTGAMYRAVGLKIQDAAVDPEDLGALTTLLAGLQLDLQSHGGETLVLLDGKDVSREIRTPEMSLLASRISAIALVREKLTGLQRQIGSKGALVAEGRDMGTVVFPEAGHKFYLDAAPEERARRRCLQLQESGMLADYQDVLAQIIKRDRDDSARALAPLKPAADGIIIDSSSLSQSEVLALMKARIMAM